METKKTIYQKLLECKNKFTAISKDQKNPHFKSAYYDINDLHKMVDPILHESGLIVLNPITEGKITTEIIDVESGDKLMSSFTLNDNINPQKIGSEITYFRRYLLSSLLGLQAEDDDGNKAAAPKPQKPKSKPKMTPEQLEAGIKALEEKKTTVKKIEDYYDLTEDQKNAISIYN